MSETAKKAVNYTEELTAKVISDYQDGVDLDAIADDIGKSVRSVRSKLVREGVYVAKPKAATSDKRKALRHLRSMVLWVQLSQLSLICLSILKPSNNSQIR